MKKQMKRLILTALLAGVSVGVPARTPGLPAADTVSGAMPAAPVSAPVAAASDTSGGERSEWLPSFTAVEVAAPVDIRFVQVPDTEAPRIIYDTKGSYTTRFRAEVRDRVLRITERRDARRPERTTVTVCYNTLERISVSDAAATFEGRFSATLLDLTVGGAAKLTADLVTVSHEHHDHNNLDIVEGRPKVAREARAAQVGGVTTQAVTSYHDDRGGALRGRNSIRIFYIDALKVVHMGDQGCLPAESVLQAILNADVMMIPVGGFYTIDAKGAKEIVDLTRPKCVIPMHYKTEHCAYPIAGVEPFLEIMGAEGAKPVRTLSVMPGDVPEGVVVMEAAEEF